MLTTRIFLLFIISFLFACHLPAQNVQLGGEQPDEAYQIISDNDGNYFVVGFTMSTGRGEADWWVGKLNTQLEIVWEKTFGFSQSDKAYDITSMPNGNIVVVGYGTLEGRGEYDIIIVVFNKDGEVVWQKYEGGKDMEEAYAITTISDSKVAVTGYNFSNAKLPNTLFVTHYDFQSDSVFTNYMTAEAGKSIASTKDGGIVITGYTGYDTSQQRAVYYHYQPFVIKIDPDGQAVWKVILESEYSAEGLDVTELEDGYLITGYKERDKFSSKDLMLVKLNPKGEIVWEKQWEGGVGNEIIPYKEGYLIGGCKTKNGIASQGWIIFVDRAGNRKWEHHFKEEEVTEIRGMILNKKGEVVFAGYVKDTTQNNISVGTIVPFYENESK